MNFHLKVAAAAMVAMLAAGCGHAAQTPGALGKGLAGAQAQTTIRKPAPAGEKQAEGGLESMWDGTVGVQSASITLSSGAWVRASVGRADFNGSTFGSSVSGSLRRDGATDNVHISGFGPSVQGRIGRDSVYATLGSSGWLSGRVGDRHVSLSVSRTMVSGTAGGQRVFLSGMGVEPGEELALTAALLVLAAAAE